MIVYVQLGCRKIIRGVGNDDKDLRTAVSQDLVNLLASLINFCL